ncbi:GNAT family N-acetyltransferase [Myxacorys almedinensis]|uniref:GNAT family N-acetyltransferase n=1 Tax=Myxacorys almedinensis A TaxID=2690445 RepID=A0A8J7Z613_9CYAN|nr:GNAT family N-acetyltransferase [Myxacorys almedinensis]NDJ16125.1 GNAT family N-acetyltransferase [Myxacorys almedinensis A]
MHLHYQDFLIRDWQPGERAAVYELIGLVLAEYGLPQEPDGADRDAIAVEECYLKTGGEFWVVERHKKLVGTGAYYPISRGKKAAEIRKMYLLPEARRRGLGKFLLGQLEQRIAEQGFTQIWIETASVLQEAVLLYERNGYQPSEGVETERCDRIYIKRL